MSGCPPEEQLSCYADDGLDADAMAVIGGHISNCERCQVWMAREQANSSWLRDVHAVVGDRAFDTQFTGYREAGQRSSGKTELLGAPTSCEAAPRVPQYDIVRELARGGQGIVYEALQQGTNRRVALKVLREGPSASSASQKRFDREIELVAQLKHPNIITIFHSGHTDDGQPFYAMDLVQGPPLHEYVRDNHLVLDETIELAAAICDAVQYAHQRGVLHRDLKPVNIVVDARGVPRILDFGLAKDLAGPVVTVASVSREVLGTLAYMSPEQARGNTDEIDTRTDVYALGVILYELLTGSYPYPVDGPFTEVLRNITDMPPTNPARAWTRNSGITRRTKRGSRPTRCPIDGEIETVLLKTLAKEPERRYQSAGELARDLRRYLGGEPIEARRDSTWYVIRKRLQRYKVPIAAVAGFILTLSASSILAWVLYVEAEAKTEKLRVLDYEHRIARAKDAHENADIRHMRDLLDSCPDEFKGWEWWYLDSLTDVSRETLSDHSGGVISIAVNRDGTLMASSSQDRTIKIWDVNETQDTTTWSLRHTLKGHQNNVRSVRFSPDGVRVLCVCDDGTIRIWDALQGIQIGRPIVGDDERFLGASFSADGTRIVCVNAKHEVKVLTAEGEMVLGPLGGHKANVYPVLSTADGKLIVTADEHGVIKVWNAQSGREERTLRGHTDGIHCMAISKDNQHIATGSVDNTVRLWNLRTGEMIETFYAHSAEVYSVSFSPVGRWLVSGGFDDTVRIWDASTGAAARTLRGHIGNINTVSFSPNGEWIASGGEDSTIKIWDTMISNPAYDQRGYPVRTLRRPGGDVHCIAMDTTGRRIAAGRHTGAISLFDALTGKEVDVFRGHSKPVQSVAFCRSGEYFVSGGLDGSIRVWKEHAEGAVRTRNGRNGEVCAIACSPKHDQVAFGCEDGTVGIWAPFDGTEDNAVKGHEALVRCVAFSPDGRQLVSGDAQGELKIWNIEHGLSESYSWRAHSGGVCSAFFDLTGQRIISADASTIRVWDARTGKLLQGTTPRGKPSDIYSLAVGHDGKRIISGEDGGTFTVWDATTLRILLTLRAHAEQILDIALSSDGARLVTGSSDDTVRVWEATPRAPMD